MAEDKELATKLSELEKKVNTLELAAKEKNEQIEALTKENADLKKGKENELDQAIVKRMDRLSEQIAQIK